MIFYFLMLRIIKWIIHLPCSIYLFWRSLILHSFLLCFLKYLLKSNIIISFLLLILFTLIFCLLSFPIIDFICVHSILIIFKRFVKISRLPTQLWSHSFMIKLKGPTTSLNFFPKFVIFISLILLLICLKMVS